MSVGHILFGALALVVLVAALRFPLPGSRLDRDEDSRSGDEE